MAASAVLALAVPTAHAAAPRAAPAAGCAATRGAVAGSLDALVTRYGVPGAAAEAVEPGCGRWTAARGVADLGSGRPMNAGDRLRIGSITKTFTATVVVQLAAEGRLGLDDPVERHLPGLIRGNGYDGRTISVRDLLQHTSGLPDYTESLGRRPVEEWRFRHFAPRELIAAALKMPHPQGKWHYATTNALLAGLVVEKATGRGVETEVTRRILRPLGLRDTYWPGDTTRIRGPHSHSYFPDPGRRDSDRQGSGREGTGREGTGREGSGREGSGRAGTGRAGPGQQGHARPQGAPLVDGTAWNTTFGGAGGALISTPADVNRFYRGLFGGRLVPAHWLAEMKRTVPADPRRLWPGARYGLGLIASPLSCGGMWWGHSGTVPGGHRALGASTPDGRGIALALTKVPDTDRAEDAFRAVVDRAFCAPGRTHQPKETE
ncbi:serine hydrolase domain-containing protein [Streptomyces angustmyceticus]|uniref:Serine hydrolase n=1 Tax=Streptomyces angustmyceticus TaxID=285578 RepID=A0A5J4LP24_9ACTN|nr:serine hydrolase domain-containing protein [Streptomyces angustmyceticus]GES32105.1 serine hydrolase [Streptomyces angustmyceticus]